MIAGSGGAFWRSRLLSPACLMCSMRTAAESRYKALAVCRPGDVMATRFDRWWRGFGVSSTSWWGGRARLVGLSARAHDRTTDEREEWLRRTGASAPGSSSSTTRPLPQPCSTGSYTAPPFSTSPATAAAEANTKPATEAHQKETTRPGISHPGRGVSTNTTGQFQRAVSAVI